MLRRRHICILLACLWLLGACSVDVEDGVGPRVPVPNVKGSVMRDGEPADDAEVEIRDAETAEELAATDTDGADFEFYGIPAGRWEAKVSGEEDGDFDSVSRIFRITTEDSLHTLPEFDIWAYGAEATEPDAGETVPKPNIFSPLEFRWDLPEDAGRELEWANVRLYDAQGDRVWSSEKDLATEIEWNGIGNEGEYANQPIQAGSYYWRLKMAFIDSLEARTRPRDLVIE